MTLPGPASALLTSLVVCAVAIAAHLPGVTAGTEPAGLALATASPALGGLLRRRRGRPRKFAEPTRVVSLTLPESLIAALANVHADLGMAVASLISRDETKSPRPSAELVVFGRRAVISVRATPALERRLGVELVPLADGRALIALDTPVTLAEFELRIADTLEDDTVQPEDREVFEMLRGILRDARRSRDVSLLRRNIIVLQSGGVGVHGTPRVDPAD
jgi:hypothetical protein